jgi:hypothetical protein
MHSETYQNCGEQQLWYTKRTAATRIVRAEGDASKTILKYITPPTKPNLLQSPHDLHHNSINIAFAFG